MNMEMNQNNWQQMNYNKKEKEEEKILKPKHIKLNLKKKTLFGSKKRKDTGKFLFPSEIKSGPK